MARKPRLFSGKGIYHAILRGNNRQNLFHSDKDRQFFLSRLKKYALELNIHIYAYCLMNNHVHILIGNAENTMSLFIQKLANSYVYFFNHKYDRCGHLFQDRFKSEPILADEYFKTVYRYILHNSEKAGLGDFDKYQWNNYSSIKDKSYNSDAMKYVKDLFNGMDNLMKFLFIKSEIKCMEFENKVFFSDERAVIFIKKLFGIKSMYTLERLDIKEQKLKCKILKNKGLSVNQISRITGISRKIIKSA